MEKRILVADCGATSCEWRLISENEILTLPSTAGFNPTFEPVEKLKQAVLSSEQLVDRLLQIETLHYYGAGCASDDNRQPVKQQLQSLFEKAEVHVDTDLWGSVRAVYKGVPLICGILGTGANSCRYDGKEITFCSPSLGFILGDEGSGNHIGRLLVRSYFYEEMPVELRGLFKTSYSLDLDSVLKSVYQKDGAAGFLASHAKFAADHIEHPFLQKLVASAMRDFLTYFVKPFPDHYELELGMVGSVAYYFQKILQKEADAMEIRLGKVLQRPIDQLAEYHRLRQ